MNNDQIQDARSGTDSQNLQEVLDAAVSAGHALQGGQQQYQTPMWLARSLAQLLPYNNPNEAYDPQCAGGNLLRSVAAYRRYGSDIDNRFEADEIQRIQGNCVKVWEAFEELWPGDKAMMFSCILANPPFGIRWKCKTPDGEGESIDSSDWTWNLIKHRLRPRGCGYFISNANTIERLKLHEDPWVYLYQRFPGGGIWDNCEVELGIIHFFNPEPEESWRQRVVMPPRLDIRWEVLPTESEIAELRAKLNFPYDMTYRPYGGGAADWQWEFVRRVIAEESGKHSKWNIWLNKDGLLRTYLSTRLSVKMSPEDVQQLGKINGCHPLTLTTERESRKVLQRFLTAGIYTIEPAARDAIVAALEEVASLSCPLRPVNDFALVAYADEEDTLECISSDPTHGIKLTVGKHYEIKTGTYSFMEEYTRKKLYTDDDTGETELREHDCELHGQDRYIQVIDDRGHIHKFMDRPRIKGQEHPEALLWQLFKKPYVPTVKEVQAEDYERNLEIMRVNEMLNSFTYFPGQLDYYARMGCKDYGLIAADVGTGKTLGALTMVALKSPKRTLIIAPQGTMRSSGDEDDAEEYQASQWVQEIRRFAPTEPVFQLFSVEDWENILRANAGELPPGIFITYPQAIFSNGAFESLPETWKESEREPKFCKHFDLELDPERQFADFLSNGVGTEKNGIRCIGAPSLYTRMAAKHGHNLYDMVIVDEAHLMCNIEARITKNLLRVQPKYRFAMTATPIPNLVTNIFSLMGWLCVPNWYKGDLRNAAWPYSVKDAGRFEVTFLSTEIDKTAQAIARAKGKKKPVCARKSPIISSPARLLKLLAPTMAYISKEDCNPDLKPCEVVDVRVKMGKQQSALYAHWLNRGNYMGEYKNALTIAMVQSARLRGVCSAPASLEYTRGMCYSNFNPKTVTILGLIRDCLRRGEQAVVVSARVGQSEEIAARLSESGVPLARIDSTIPAELHTAEANRFKKGDARVMLMGIKCAQGHSFDQCPNLIIGSLEWSYGTLHQAKGRVWRLTSPKPVKVWCVLHKGTIEELLFDRVAMKQDAATICLRGQRVARDFRVMDPSEVLAEHVVNFDHASAEVMSEVECESQWPELRRQLALATTPTGTQALEVEETAESAA